MTEITSGDRFIGMLLSSCCLIRKLYMGLDIMESSALLIRAATRTAPGTRASLTERLLNESISRKQF